MEMRKGKVILFYEFNIDCNWRAVTKENETEGKLHIKDFNDNDTDFEVSGITCDTESSINTKCKMFLKKMAKDEIIKATKTMYDELIQAECNDEKITQDKLNRELQDKLVKEANLKNGELKEKLFEEQKKKDLEFKEKINKIN